MTTTTDRLTAQFAFLLECDRLKEVFRQSLNSVSRRRENDAEHSWAVCLFAITLAEHSNVPIDVLRVVKMLLVHDVVEIDAGDTFAYDTSAMRDQHEREARAADRIFGLLPPDQALEFRALWDEFEARQTAAARFAHSVDRLQAMLLNCVTHGESWRRHGVTHGDVIARNTPIADGSSTLWTYIRGLVDEAVRDGHLAT
jgi:putative hydrolase of HD superfamily